ncbi:MAG: hypothetical protein ACREQW_05570, partial [Candidatus Binatia bacterium]
MQVPEIAPVNAIRVECALANGGSSARLGSLEIGFRSEAAAYARAAGLPDWSFPLQGSCGMLQSGRTNERKDDGGNMGIAQEQKLEVIEQFKLHRTDTGSPEV